MLWFEQDGKKVPVVPQCMVPDVIALVHLFHGDAGVGATMHFVKRYFFWPRTAGDVRQYVLSCSCRRLKRPTSRRVAMLPDRALEPWDELQMDILNIRRSLSIRQCVRLVVVDRASKFPFGFPLETKHAIGVATNCSTCSLTLGVPKCISCDGAIRVHAEVVKHVCRWMQAPDIRFGPADHPRGQGAVERLGGWLQEMLSELCKLWPDRWDEYVSPALWMKRTLPDASLPSNMSPFELLFGRPPRTSLDTLVPLSGEAENTRGLDNFVEQRRQNMLEVRQVMERRNELRMEARAKANATILRPSAGVSADRGSLVLVRTPASLRHRDRRGMKLQHDVYTGPWTVVEVLEKGLSVQVEMRGLKQRSRRVSVADVKPFHVRPVHLRHSIADEFAQYAWGPDLKLPESSELLPTYQSLADCRQVVSQTGRLRWEFKGLSAGGVVSDWQDQSKMLQTFTPLQLDGFLALWHLYNPDAAVANPSPSPNSLSRAEALRMFPLGLVVWKRFPGGTRLKGQVYDFKAPYWRVRYSEGIWEELTRTELQKLAAPKL